MSSERSDVKAQIARMQAEIERLEVTGTDERKKLRDFLKDEIAKIESQLEKLDAEKDKLAADKDEFQALLTKLEGSDDTQKPENAGEENQENK